MAKTASNFNRGVDAASAVRLHSHLNVVQAFEWVSQSGTRCVPLAGTRWVFVTMTSQVMRALWRHPSTAHMTGTLDAAIGLVRAVNPV